jgi:hypothetical protein
MIVPHTRFIVVVICLSLSTFAQTSQAPLTDSQKKLIAGSKEAIIRTGLSDIYFAKHFKLFRVFDSESDRRVMWEFEVNGHKTMIVDAVGYHTQGNQRIAIHSVANSLGKTFEITHTLNRSTALRRMRACIGAFEEPSIQYGAVDGRAELFLSAAAKRIDRLSAKEREREREREESGRKKATVATGDFIESEEEEKGLLPIVIGNINLVTGKCTKGAGQVAP